MTTNAPAHLGIDLGTSSVKVVVLDGDGTQVAQADATYDVSHPRPGWAESTPRDWWEATVTAVRTAVQAAPALRPVSVGLSGQMHGVVPTRSDGSPVRDAVLWADARAEDEVELYRRLPHATRQRLANPLTAGMAGPILAWLVRHESESMTGMRWALQPKDWLRLQLTGEVHTEPSDASATLLYDVLADGWATDVVDALGLDPRVLPPVLPSSSSPAGTLTPLAADRLGLPVGLPVAAGAGDTAAAGLGSGLVVPGTAQLTIGTGIQVVTPVERPVRGAAEPVIHCYRAATDAGHYRMAAAYSGGLALRWVCGLLDASWAELYATAEQTPREDDPIFLPHVSGERTPYLDASMRGAWTGLGAQHTRTDLLRSALEGVAFAAADAWDAVFPDGDVVGPLRLAGGGTTSGPWRRLLADVLEVDLAPVAVPGASGRGAALLGALAAGLLTESALLALATPAVTTVVRPDPLTAARYRDRRTRFRHTVEQLRSDCSPAHRRLA